MSTREENLKWWLHQSEILLIFTSTYETRSSDLHGLKIIFLNVSPTLWKWNTKLLQCPFKHKETFFAADQPLLQTLSETGKTHSWHQFHCNSIKAINPHSEALRKNYIAGFLGFAHFSGLQGLKRERKRWVYVTLPSVWTGGHLQPTPLTRQRPFGNIPAETGLFGSSRSLAGSSEMWSWRCAQIDSFKPSWAVLTFEKEKWERRKFVRKQRDWQGARVLG